MTMTNSEIEYVCKRLVDAKLPKEEWTHEAHVAAGIWLEHHPDYDAERDMPGIIRAHNASVGTPNTDSEGYHETITIASIRRIRALLSELSEDASLSAALSHALEAGLDKTDWILAYWSPEKLFSVKARKTWVEPDLKPF